MTTCTGNDPGCNLPPASPAYRLRKLRELVARLRARAAAGGHVNLEWLAELERGVDQLERAVRP